MSHRTEQKIVQKHRIQLDELENVLVDVRGLKASWDEHIMRYMERGEFFEDDEPVEDVLAAFSAGQAFLTAGSRTTPERGWTASVRIGDQADPGDTYAASVACVHQA